MDKKILIVVIIVAILAVSYLRDETRHERSGRLLPQMLILGSLRKAAEAESLG